jgi:hypothetical protein
VFSQKDSIFIQDSIGHYLLNISAKKLGNI